LGAHFTAEKSQGHGAMHSTNKAFERYMQHHGEPSTQTYAESQELKGKRGPAKACQLFANRVASD